MPSFPGNVLIRYAVKVKIYVEVTIASVYWHIVYIRSCKGLISRPNYLAPRHVSLHFGGGTKTHNEITDLAKVMRL